MDIKPSKQYYYRISIEEVQKGFYQKLNTSKENVLRNNDKINYYAGEIVFVSTNDYKTHIVKPAETLKDICQKYNMLEETLIKDNNLVSNKLFIGQSLKIYNKKAP